MDKDLKLCPFCGGKAELHHTNGEMLCYVKCTICGAETGIVKAALEYCANDKAIEAWNRRASDDD